MQTRHEGIIRAINNSGKFNVLTAPVHERTQSNWSSLPCDFYMYQHPSFNKWKVSHAKIPSNHILLSGRQDQIKADMKFDIVLSQNKFGNFQILAPIAEALNLPLISLEHTLPMPQWSDQHLANIRKMNGNINVFISEYSCKQWGYDPEDKTVRILHHGIDIDLFQPVKNGHNDGKILSVCNDWINRDLPCNFQGFQRITKDLPINPVGNTPGFSEAAKDTADLVSKYQKASVFINTSNISPIPTALLEAMACGCPVVTTATCMIPEIVKDGYNGWISNDEAYLRDRTIWCLNNPDKAIELGLKARDTILKDFSLKKHLESWIAIYKEVYGKGRYFG